MDFGKWKTKCNKSWWRQKPEMLGWEQIMEQEQARYIYITYKLQKTTLIQSCQILVPTMGLWSETCIYKITRICVSETTYAPLHVYFVQVLYDADLWPPKYNLAKNERASLHM